MNKPIAKSCIQCSVAFTALTNKQRFCSVVCRKNWPINKEKAKSNANDYKRNNPLVAKGIKLKRYYGITTDEYYTMVNDQGGVCKICKESCLSGRELCVDHCHKTGKIRGLLCGTCNSGLGSFKDKVELLTSAIKYLEGEGEN